MDLHEIDTEYSDFGYNYQGMLFLLSYQERDINPYGGRQQNLHSKRVRPKNFLRNLRKFEIINLLLQYIPTLFIFEKFSPIFSNCKGFDLILTIYLR